MNKTSLIVPLIIIGSMFALLGFALGINAFFIPYVKEVFQISTMKSYLLMTASFSAYIVFGIPSLVILKKYGYRKGMVIAFLLMALGFFFIAPASGLVSFPLFLIALFINGMGQALLTSTVNTYITIIGSPENAASRIAMMGICNKFAYAGASLILAAFISLSNIHVEDAIIPFYIITAILILFAGIYYFMPLPEVKAVGEEEGDNTLSSSDFHTRKSIFQYPHLILGIVALFFDVGVETIALGTINDYAVILKLPSPENFVWLTSIGMVMGYLFGAAFIPKIISQQLALAIFALSGMVVTVAIVLLPPGISIYMVGVLGLSNSMLWPTIWPLAISDLGRLTKTGSSLLVMGITGGAILPLAFGYLADIHSYQHAYIVCLIAYVFIIYYALWGHKIRLQPTTGKYLSV